ncbi:MAG TPA: 3-deoxy-manno-octulosonate cytidylyltransferase [Longimicrobiaceae bacterium]|nr:3-deoxy-manno-octulosonate cytidylyltransferase [Longimicrobiaceae bacterium]
MNGSVLGVIPARLGSTRLPRKPLHLMAGRPLLEWVWRRVVSLGVCAEVVVATDSDEVADVARGFGARVELTSPDHPSGTDRVAEVAELPAYAGHDTIVNVQGDEPFIRAETLQAAAALVAEAGWAVGTAAAPIGAVHEWLDPAVVKVALAADGGALLFSRAPIPFVRDGEPTADQLAGGEFLRHVGLYAYRRDALRRWVALPEGRLERLERLEQLRPLAAGIRIGVARVQGVELGVDTPADAAAAEARLRDINPSDVLS